MIYLGNTFFQIKEKEKYLQDIERQLNDHTSRTQLMRDHLKNVQTEFLNTQFFNNSKRKEIDTEKHMKQVLDREAGRVRVDSEKLQKEIEEILEKVVFLQTFFLYFYFIGQHCTK